MNPSPDAVATLVDETCKGDEQALATLLPLVYDGGWAVRTLIHKRTTNLSARHDQTALRPVPSAELWDTTGLTAGQPRSDADRSSSGANAYAERFVRSIKE